MVEVEADIWRLLRGPRHQRIVDDQIPDRRREVGDEDLAEALRNGNPGPLSAFEPFEIGGPLSARRDGEKGLDDEAPVSNHGADEEFEEGQGGAVRNGLGQQGQPGAERGRDWHLVAWIGGAGTLSPTRVPGYAMRIYSGHPRSSRHRQLEP